MAVSSTIRIRQIIPDPHDGSIRDVSFSKDGDVNILTGGGSVARSFNQTHLPVITYPKAVVGQTGWPTENLEDWSDSPELDPLRDEDKRWSWGRGVDRDTPGTYGRLSNYSGFLMYERLFSRTGDYFVINDQTINSGDIRNLPDPVIGSVKIYEPEQVDGDTTVLQRFLVSLASPVPFSFKNPVNTDVSIRLSNYAYILNSGTVTLSLEDEERTLALSGFEA
ncbi:hypothetical protein LCGC14_2102340, partial [marine sediment metagenome]